MTGYDKLEKDIATLKAILAMCGLILFFVVTFTCAIIWFIPTACTIVGLLVVTLAWVMFTSFKDMFTR